MLSFIAENVGNFHEDERVSKRFSRYSVGCYSYIFIFGFPTTISDRSGQSQSTFLYFSKYAFGLKCYKPIVNMKNFLLAILSMALFAITANAQVSIPVQNKVYEGSIQGMMTLTIDFKADGIADVTMSLLGNKDTKKATYEQNENQIIVHAQNGDMTFSQSDNNVLNTTIKGILVSLVCQTPDTNIEKIKDVAHHTFSGDYGNNGKLTLSFSENGLVTVTVITNNQQQEENWLYIQEEDTIVITEPMGRKITLTLNGNNALKGMFTIVNVTLPMIN